MIKILHTLLASMSVMSVSFAADAPELRNLTPETATATIITDETKPVFMCGYQTPTLYYDEKAGKFVGSEIELAIKNHQLIIRNDQPSIIFISDISGFSQISNRLTPPTLCVPAKFYDLLHAEASKIALGQSKQQKALKLTTCDLLKMRQITAAVFPNDPNSWKLKTPNELYDHSRAIVTKILNMYHLPSLTDDITARMKDLEAEADTLTSIAKKTYHRNISSDQCHPEIKSAFLNVSEILAISAYHYRAKGLSPLRTFTENSFPSDVAAIITVLFELDDKTHDYQFLDILGTNVQITGLPVLTEPQQIDFVTRWITAVLSPSIIKVDALLANQRDGFALIPEIVNRAETLWDEYERYVFGKTTHAVFKKQPK